MVDPISNAPNLRENGASQTRPQASPSLPGALNPASNLAPDQRVGEIHAAVENLIKKSLPGNSKLQIEQDKETGTFIYRSIDPETGKIIRQWPPEDLLKLRQYLKEMEGMLVDTQV
jgi:flagellar protein FlaG